MLQQPLRLRRHTPTVRIRQLPPSIHQPTYLTHITRNVILLILRRKPLTIAKNQLFLLTPRTPTPRFRYRRYKLRLPPSFIDPLRRLPRVVKLPMQHRILIRRVQYRLFKKLIRHRLPRLTLFRRNSTISNPSPCVNPQDTQFRRKPLPPPNHVRNNREVPKAMGA